MKRNFEYIGMKYFVYPHFGHIGHGILATDCIWNLYTTVKFALKCKNIPIFCGLAEKLTILWMIV